MIIVGLNQVSAAYDMDYGALAASAQAQAHMRAAMLETVAVAQAEGIELTPACVDTGMGYLASFQRDGMPSMRQDVLAKRLTEVDEFAGVVRRLAQKHGIPTPENDDLYSRLRAIEADYTPNA
jgi:2-dehydropantoate 2-reductase